MTHPDESADLAPASIEISPQTQRREMRGNVIALTVLLGLMLPGVIIVFKKKLSETDRSWMPASVRTEHAVMDNTDAGSARGSRVMPPQTRAYLLQFAQQKTRMGGALPVRQDEPAVMGERRVIQLISQQSKDGRHRMGFILWNSKIAPIKSIFTIVAHTPAGDIPGVIDAIEANPLPIDVRSELQDHGFVMPPGQTVYLEAQFETAAPIESIDLKYRSGPNTLDDTLVLRR